MNNPKFCDLRVCAKATGEVNTGFPDEEAVKEYRTEFLAPYTVGARKGIFVPRELVNKLAKTVALFDNRDLTIGGIRDQYHNSPSRSQPGCHQRAD